MKRIVLASLAVLALSAGSLRAADENKKSQPPSHRATSVTITKIDATKGEITLKYNDEGKEREKTYKLTSDIRLLDETGRVVKIDVFESGQDALIVESEGRLREMRRSAHRPQARSLYDAVTTLMELSSYEDGSAAELQRIYDMLRELDIAKNGKIDPNALKAAGNRVLEERVNGAFERLDTNKDGKISKDEAKGLIKEHFDRIDANHDGFIDRNELLRAAKERRAERRDEKTTSAPKQVEKEKN